MAFLAGKSPSLWSVIYTVCTNSAGQTYIWHMWPVCNLCVAVSLSTSPTCHSQYITYMSQSMCVTVSLSTSPTCHSQCYTWTRRLLQTWGCIVYFNREACLFLHSLCSWNSRAHTHTHTHTRTHTQVTHAHIFPQYAHNSPLFTHSCSYTHTTQAQMLHAFEQPHGSYVQNPYALI